MKAALTDLLTSGSPQIHRSTIVNLKAIAGIARDDAGRGVVRLKNRSETLIVSAPFMALFRHM